MAHRFLTSLPLILLAIDVAAAVPYSCVVGSDGGWICSGESSETLPVVETKAVETSYRSVAPVSVAAPVVERELTKTEETELDSARYRFSFDDIPVSSTENMGTVGIHYDIKPFDLLPDLYLGVGGYGAMTGDYGGFFVGGATLGWHHYLDVPLLAEDLAIDAGLFAGGGGGAGAFPGGGLMLRSHLMVEKELSPFTLRFGVARIAFPNTSNTAYESDTHLTAGLSLPTHNLAGNSLGIPGISDYRGAGVTKITPVIAVYSPDSDAKKRSGSSLTEDVTLVGFQHYHAISSSLYRTFEVYGAGQGGTDGYAKVLGGIGVNRSLIPGLLNWDAKISAGMAGGGGIDTGGGLIIQPMVGLELELGERWSLKSMVGKTYAPNGNFSSTTAEVAISWEVRESETDYSLRHKTYFPTSSALTKSGGEYADSIHLLGIVLSKQVNEWTAISGSAYGAWGGGVGAYAEGLFGVEIQPFGWPLLMRYEAGVGGGGGMDVGEGLIHQWSLGAELPLTNKLDATADIGVMQGMDGGTFDATLLQLGLTW